MIFLLFYVKKAFIFKYNVYLAIEYLNEGNFFFINKT